MASEANWPKQVQKLQTESDVYALQTLALTVKVLCTFTHTFPLPPMKDVVPKIFGCIIFLK